MKIIKTEVASSGVRMELENGVIIAVCPNDGPRGTYINIHFGGEKDPIQVLDQYANGLNIKYNARKESQS